MKKKASFFFLNILQHVEFPFIGFYDDDGDYGVTSNSLQCFPKAFQIRNLWTLLRIEMCNLGAFVSICSERGRHLILLINQFMVNDFILLGENLDQFGKRIGLQIEYSFMVLRLAW